MKNWVLVGCLMVGATAFADDIKGTGQVDLFAGAIHQDGSPTRNHGILGISGGYGLTSRFQAFGEFSYVPLGINFAQVAGISAKELVYTGGVKASIFKSKKIDPYLLVGGGGVSFLGRCGCNETDGALHVGLGVRLQWKEHWGLVPEARYIRVFASNNGINAITYTGGVFFRWGGKK